MSSRRSVAVVFWLSLVVGLLVVASARAQERGLLAGQAVVDITPPLDVQPGGVFALPDKPRKYAGVRQAAEARVIVLRVKDTSAVIVSLDLLAVGKEFTARVQGEIAKRTKIPAGHVRVCATHTHSMPTLKWLRFHGELPEKYMAQVEKKIVEAVVRAEADLSPAELHVGRARADGANFNRTSKTWKTDADFGKGSSDAERWLDTSVHVLHFRRKAPEKPDLLWYHFSAHPVVYRDDPGAGPDWPGLVNRMAQAKFKCVPSYLQGHCGDVNPGDGKTFLGDPVQVAQRVFDAIEKAVKDARRVPVNELRLHSESFGLPLDLERMRKDVASFEADPEKTTKERGWFKNMAFAKDWHAWAKKWDAKQTTYPVQLSVLCVGDVALAFHPGELYSYYGLAIRRDSPFRDTIVVGYVDDLVGYVPDPAAYLAQEYAAVTVPKIVNLPPFTPSAGREMSQALVRLLTMVKTPGLKGMLPRLDPLPPAEALKAFRIEKGFRVELVACEPDVVDPIALAFDEAGRLFVAEDIDYPFPPRPGEKTLGRIRMLVDRDGDGRFETSTIFADNLQWPSGIAIYKGGIFVAAPPRIWYLQDTDGDGKADVRRIVFDGFGTAAAEDIMNNLKWGLDNHIYGASSYNGGDVFQANKKDVVSVRGRDFRFDPATEKLEPLAGTGDFGNCFDDWGNRFVSNAGMLLIHNVLPGNYLSRNPHLLVKEVNYRSAASKKTMASISPPEPWRVVRKRFWDKWVNTTPDMRASRFSAAELAEGGLVTGGAGCEIYRGAAFPAEYHGNSFTAEPAGNVVIRLKLNPNGLTFDATAIDEKREFLASTDNWFRPVNVANGPDGCLYICDMSREIIEDPSAIPDDILKIVDVTRGRDRGRIYRIVPEGFKRPASPQLSKTSTKDLVALLERPNAWWRETAQRLLLERQDKSAVEPLRALIRNAKLSQARLHALWTLHGLSSLDDDLLIFALSDAHAAIREHGVRLSEGRLAESLRVRKQCLLLAADKEPRVRLQVAFSLGAIAEREETADALATILLQDSNDRWMRSAVLSSVGERPIALYMELLRRTPEGTLLEALLPPLAEQVAAREQGADIRRVLGSLTEPALRARPKVTETILLALADRLALSRILIAEMLKDPTPLTVRQLFEASLSQAAKTAGSDKSPMPERLRAIRLLRHAPLDQVGPVLASLISIEHPPEIQLAGVQAFAGKIDGKIAGLLLERWRGSGPQVHPEIVEVLLGQSEGVTGLIEALEKKSIAAGELSPVHRDILLKKAGPALRERAAKLFAATATSSRKQVLDKYQAALKLTGDTVRGQKIFTMNCATCHRLGDVGKAVGPDLLATKDKTPDSLLIAILDPSREMSANFVNYVVTTKNGRVVTGMLAGESPTTITLRRADVAEDIVARADIEEFASTRLSLMPDGLEDRIDLQQMADLLRFLLERK